MQSTLRILRFIVLIFLGRPKTWLDASTDTKIFLKRHVRSDKAPDKLVGCSKNQNRKK